MITYKEYVQFISADGAVYNFSTSIHTLMSETGSGMAPINLLTQQAPMQHGASLMDYRLQPRTIQLLFRADGCSREEYWANRAELLNILRINRSTQITGVLRYNLPDGSVRDIDVVCDAGPAFESRSLTDWDEWAFTETLRFYAPDPTFYDPTLVTVNWSLSNPLSELDFPITFPIQFGSSVLTGQTKDVTYAGTWGAYPQIVITGPLSGFALENTTIGTKLALNYAVRKNETVTITTEPNNKTVTSSLGTNLRGAVTKDSDLTTFHIEPDPQAPSGVNHLTIAGASATSSTGVVLTYYTRYIGI